MEKFREFTDHYIRYVEGFGKQACVWGALTHAKGETPVKAENVIMSAGITDMQSLKKWLNKDTNLFPFPTVSLYRTCCRLLL